MSGCGSEAVKGVDASTVGKLDGKFFSETANQSPGHTHTLRASIQEAAPHFSCSRDISDILEFLL